ncbi:DUF5134 domain-containing protein [Streptomyces sp. NPDC007025]|uniref:DUF5134 domain-containing protein n=1 Tax=Streptomyces sp. NPDC007025 TaxID=3364771 RepID=UPI003683EEA2
MHGPETVGWLLTALCAVTGVSCLLRARGAGPGRRSEAGGEAVMGLGMAAMAAPAPWSGTPATHTVSGWVFGGLFGALLVRELRLTATVRHTGAGPGRHLHHLLGSAAMVYMSLAMALGPPAGAAAHHSGAGGLPLVTGMLLVYFAGYVLWTGTRLMPAGAAPGSGPAARRTAVPPVARQAGVAAGCRVAMGAGMFAMLLAL